MDVLSDVLSAVRLKSTVFAQSELLAPWGARASPREQFVFHVVTRGHAYLGIGRRAPMVVDEGDVVVVAPGVEHTLTDAPDSEATPIETLLAEGRFGRPVRPGARGDRTHLVCGCFHLEELGGDALIAALPKVIHTRLLPIDAQPWIAQTVKLLRDEVLTARPGTETVVNRLCEMLFIYVLRAQLAEERGRASWLKALKEPQIGAALQLMHERPAHRWDLTTLARQVGMSRSAFAARFAGTVGETPMQYLARWRLQKAAGLLREGGAGLAAVASQVGYESEAAFNKAFKRTLGVAPGAYRKASRRRSLAAGQIATR